MVDRVIINDATYATLLKHYLSTQGPGEALLLGQVRVIQENVIDDNAENLIKCTTEVAIACALCFPEGQGISDRSNVSLDTVASALAQASPQCTQNTYVVGWAPMHRRHPADRFSTQEKALAASLLQCIPALYEISAKQPGSQCRGRPPPCPIPCICLDMRLSTQNPAPNGIPSTPMLQCDVVALEVEAPGNSGGQSGAPQRAPGATSGQWNMIRLQRKPVVLNGLRNTGAEALYNGFRPHIAGPISFMQQQDALEMQSACRQQADRLFHHSANGVAQVHKKVIDMLKSTREIQELESLAAHCASLTPPRQGTNQAR